MGTHQGAVRHRHRDYYLDEFTFRLKRRKSKNRGKLFYRLIQQTVAIGPVPLNRPENAASKSSNKLCKCGPAKNSGRWRIAPAGNQAMASIPRMDASVRSFAAGPLGNLLAALPFADNANRDIQISGKNGLAYIGFGADTPDGGRAQFANRSQTGNS